MEITVQECIESAKKGWYVILHNGKIMGFRNEPKEKEDGD